MTEGKLYLQSQLASIVDSSSLETVLEYLQATESRDEMVLFLEDICGYNELFGNIIEKYIKIRSTPPVVTKQPKAQQQKATNSSTQRGKLNASASHFKPGASKGQTEDTTKAGISTKSKQRSAQPTGKGGGVRRGPQTLSGQQVCGCMATHHSFFASCLACGRIHCSKEQEQEQEQTSCCCVFCGAPLLLKTTSAAALSNQSQNPSEDLEAYEQAYAQKDKLLVFDKECTQRTHVFDAQGDYYETGTWLSEEERQGLDEREAQRRERARRRPRSRMVQVVSFDVAGRKTVQYLEEDAEKEHDERDQEEKEQAGDRAGQDALEASWGQLSLENSALLSGGGGGKAAALYQLLRDRLVQGQSGGSGSESSSSHNNNNNNNNNNKNKNTNHHHHNNNNNKSLSQQRGQEGQSMGKAAAAAAAAGGGWGGTEKEKDWGRRAKKSAAPQHQQPVPSGTPGKGGQGGKGHDEAMNKGRGKGRDRDRGRGKGETLQPSGGDSSSSK